MKKFSTEWWQSIPPEKVGNETEKLVEKLFAEWNRQQTFAWHRMPDAKAARGRLQAQPSDYIYRNGFFAGHIELKALKHPFRLPRARVSQLPTLLKWSLAGSGDVVLVFHYMENVWRVMYPTELDPEATSWDLREFPAYASAEEALKSTVYFS